MEGGINLFRFLSLFMIVGLIVALLVNMGLKALPMVLLILAITFFLLWKDWNIFNKKKHLEIRNKSWL